VQQRALGEHAVHQMAALKVGLHRLQRTGFELQEVSGDQQKLD
jgi:hypothetical protein